MNALKQTVGPALLALALFAAPLSAQAPAAAVAPPLAPPQPTALQSGGREGVIAAQAAGTGTWTLSGFAGGLLLGPIGTGLAFALASGSASTLPAELSERIGNRESDYQLGFQQAYSQRITKRRRSSALVGGLSGTTVFLAAAGVLLSR